MKKRYIYECHYTEQKIKIDGILNEKTWNKAKILNFYIPVTNEKPISKTQGRLLWDNKYLYVGFKAYDKDIWGYFTKRDEFTYREDCLEIYFKTHPKKEPYYNFEINALGTVFDAFNVRRESAGATYRWSKWNCKGLKVGIKIKGTLNNCEDVDEYWQMEVAIPFESLPTLRGRTPKENDKWLFHLSRYDYSIYLSKGVELSSCALLSKADFAFYEEWPVLKFIK
ncbi:MAG: carbohydrate-binding family 9-like protein [bacterium]